MIRAAFVLALVVAVAFAARSFLPDTAVVTGSGAALAFGFLLIAAVQIGHIFHDLKLPHLTGFILCGAVFGPEVLGLLTPAMLGDLSLVKKVAVGLIALLAGAELNVRALRAQLKSIGLISAVYLPVTMLGLFVFFAVLLQFLPFAEAMSLKQRLAVALIAANVLCALSPAVVIGILSETRSEGPLSKLSMSVVVVADLLIVLTFSLSDSLGHAVFPAPGGAHPMLGGLAVHIFGSIAAGAAVGGVFALYIKRIGERIGLFVFGVLFVVAEVGSSFHLDPLLVGLSAGLFLENLSPVGGARVIRLTEPASLPTFALFFSVVGAEVHLHAFRAVAPFAIGAALVRAAGIYFGSRLGARLAGLEPALERRIPFGMFPQAGIAIGLANLVAQSHPDWGQHAATLILGTVVINELVGPVLLRLVLHRAGELGMSRLEGAATRPAHASVPPPEVRTPLPSLADD